MLQSLNSPDSSSLHDFFIKADIGLNSLSCHQWQRRDCCHRNTVANLRQRLVQQVLEAAVERKQQKNLSRQRRCDGEAQAKLIAWRCGEPPAGQARWTLRLLADKAVELEIVPAISHETVGQELKKTRFCPIYETQYVIPPQQSAEFVANIEDVLEVYHQPYEPKYPMIGIDEQLVQLIKQTRTPLSVQPGHPEAIDYEYERNETACLFIFTETLCGWRCGSSSTAKNSYRLGSGNSTLG